MIVIAVPTLASKTVINKANKPLEIAVVPIVHTGQSIVDAIDAIVHTRQSIVDAAETLIDLHLNSFQRSNATLDGWHLHNFFFGIDCIWP